MHVSDGHNGQGRANDAKCPIKPVFTNLDDASSPGSMPYKWHTAVGRSFDTDVVHSQKLPSHSCSPPHHGKDLPQRPPAAANKENILPRSPETNRHSMAAQRRSSSHSPSDSLHITRPHQLGPHIPSGLPPLQTLLSLTLHGQPISFDLKTLDDDPRSIIELLNATSSDRDKWMIVGAFYRRKGNVHAALIVVTTMVKALNDLGIKDHDMRPAFLMLSSCHTELWRQTRAPDGIETETSAAHLDKSRRWLQLVYGPMNPETTSEHDPGMLDTLAPVDATPRQTHDVSAREDTTCNRFQRSRTSIERDLQVLRDRQAHHVEELATTREAKRRFEDEAVNERVIRRRLERALRDLQNKLTKAQRRADEAQALVRTEVNTRRRYEQAIADERAKRRALEERFRNQAQTARPLLVGLHTLLHNADGQVKGDEFMGTATGG